MVADDKGALMRFEVRAPKWRFAAAAIGIVAFVVLGIVLMVLPGNILAMSAGALSIVFFGGFCTYGLLRTLRGRGRLAILPIGLEVDLPGLSPRIVPWEDIEAVGVLSMSGQEFTTLRLRSYGSFLSEISPAEAKRAVQFFRALGFVGRAAVGLGAAHLQGVGDLNELLSGSDEIGSVADILRFNRAKFGAEFLFGWSMRDRPASAFAELLERARTTSA